MSDHETKKLAGQTKVSRRMDELTSTVAPTPESGSSDVNDNGDEDSGGTSDRDTKRLAGQRNVSRRMDELTSTIAPTPGPGSSNVVDDDGTSDPSTAGSDQETKKLAGHRKVSRRMDHLTSTVAPTPGSESGSNVNEVNRGGNDSGPSDQETKRLVGQSKVARRVDHLTSTVAPTPDSGSSTLDKTELGSPDLRTSDRETKRAAGQAKATRRIDQLTNIIAPTPGSGNQSSNENGIPDYDDLPLRKGDPFRSAWGLYGEDDQLGTLNRLTDERVAAAARDEIKTGKRVSLNWSLSAQGTRRSFFQRALFHQELIAKAPRVVNDDVWTFNSQVSTQWDGLRHFAYQHEKLFYDGVTQQDIHSVNEKGEGSTVLGIQAWAEQGIVGRGILVDFHSWRLSQPDAETKPYDSFESTAISADDLKACLAAQGTEVKFGDILIIRSGFMATLPTKSADEIWAHQEKMPHPFGGVEQSEDVLRWIWSNFSAVAGDQPSFERWPSARKDWSLHEVLLAGWGCPIGELFDLERLAEECKRLGRWSFFLASEPCNVPGGVASPPNVLAIF